MGTASGQPQAIDVVSVGEGMVELSAREPVALEDARTFDLGWGGDTSNVAVAAARLGLRAAYVTRVGDDGFGRSLLDLWRREGVDVAAARVDPTRPTGIYFLSRPARGAHAFTYYRSGSAASTLGPEDVPEAAVLRARVLHTSGITQALGPAPRAAVSAALRAARRAGTVTSYDPNLRTALWPLDEARAVIMTTLELADVVFPSLEDAQALTGLEDPGAIVGRFLDAGAGIVALKLGPAGALVADGSTLRTAAPYEVTPIDQAGAGDTFVAAFLTAWLEGHELVDCADFANAAAALTTTGVGCVDPIPSRAAVDDLRRGQAPARQR